MKIIRILLTTVALLTSTSMASSLAQEKSQQPEEAKRTTETKVYVPLRIQVVFSEYEGEKKISSIPYVLHHNAEASGTRTSIRMGIRVPIVVKDNQVQYQNVGTDIDCLAAVLPDGLFRLNLQLHRSSVYTPGPESKPSTEPAAAGTPFFREFSGSVDALLRDGQTAQSAMATDPASGRVLKLDVTLNVVK